MEIPGLDYALERMQVREKSFWHLPSDWAYDSGGAPSYVPSQIPLLRCVVIYKCHVHHMASDFSRILIEQSFPVCPDCRLLLPPNTDIWVEIELVDYGDHIEIKEGLSEVATRQRLERMRRMRVKTLDSAWCNAFFRLWAENKIHQKTGRQILKAMGLEATSVNLCTLFSFGFGPMPCAEAALTAIMLRFGENDAPGLPWADIPTPTWQERVQDVIDKPHSIPSNHFSSFRWVDITEDSVILATPQDQGAYDNAVEELHRLIPANVRIERSARVLYNK